MKKWLKKHFIPHEGNNHRPHFLQTKNTKRVVGAVLFFELVLFILPVLNFADLTNQLNMSAVLPGVLSTLTNEERVSNNLPVLSVNPQLARAAQLKAEDMATKGYFAHNSPEGKTPWYWITLAGYSYLNAGENLAVNFSDSEEVTEAWMNSPTHRANIVAGAYTEMGTGIATGMYKGRETVFVAQVYGKPVAASAKSENSRALPSENFASTDPNPGSKAPTLALVPQSQVLGETASSPVKTPTYLQKLFSSPKESTNGLLSALLTIIFVALFLNLAIRFNFQHPDLIRNSVVAAGLILAIQVGNSYVAENNFQTSFVAFEAESESN